MLYDFDLSLLSAVESLKTILPCLNPKLMKELKSSQILYQ